VWESGRGVSRFEHGWIANRLEHMEFVAGAFELNGMFLFGYVCVCVCFFFPCAMDWEEWVKI
jgi:hypothetical protein